MIGPPVNHPDAEWPAVFFNMAVTVNAVAYKEPEAYFQYSIDLITPGVTGHTSHGAASARHTRSSRNTSFARSDQEPYIPHRCRVYHQAGTPSPAQAILQFSGYRKDNQPPYSAARTSGTIAAAG